MLGLSPRNHHGPDRVGLGAARSAANTSTSFSGKFQRIMTTKPERNVACTDPI